MSRHLIDKARLRHPERPGEYAPFQPAAPPPASCRSEKNRTPKHRPEKKSRIVPASVLARAGLLPAPEGAAMHWPRSFRHVEPDLPRSALPGTADPGVPAAWDL